MGQVRMGSDLDFNRLCQCRRLRVMGQIIKQILGGVNRNDVAEHLQVDVGQGKFGK